MNAGGWRLLIVDDNEDNRYTLAKRLDREGYANVVMANDGREALEILQREHIDLALLDIMMPEMNGYQVLERLKADPKLRDIPVIMISAVEEIESVARCIELGAEDYLPKPFNATLLRARVGASLEKKQLRDAVRSSLERLERELEGARALQMAMLPAAFPAWTTQCPVELHADMVPAREVGGDLYDFFLVDERTLCFMLGDVSGKGAPAAMFMARMRSLVRMAIELWERFEPGTATASSIARAVNRELARDNRERMFVTLYLGFLDTATGELAHVNAGHPAPYLLRSGRSLERIDGRRSAPLGVRADVEYSTNAVRLQPRDRVFVFSDGVTDAANGSEELYGESRLEQALGAAGGASAERLVRDVKSSVEKFAAGAPRADDVTMLALEWRPAHVPSPA